MTNSLKKSFLWDKDTFLYHPSMDKDSCGMGFIASIKESGSHQVVKMGLQILERLDHRGARGCDVNSGDGAGIMLGVPHDFFAKKYPNLQKCKYALGMVFLPLEESKIENIKAIFQSVAQRYGVEILFWREVPIDTRFCGSEAIKEMPSIKQVFIRNIAQWSEEKFERILYIIRRVIEKKVRLIDQARFYICSLSIRTVVYKGQLTCQQVSNFFLDLQDEDFKTHFSMVHSRFSTNTFPSWKRAHPFRYISHNGEINTLRGNVNWMHARQSLFQSEEFQNDMQEILPIIDDVESSDSGIFDNVFELLVHAKKSIAQAMMMMVPEPWQHASDMDQQKRDFYQYYSCMMEPWDGPASIAFCDGHSIGVALDRNGLRPSRYVITKDGFVVVASEIGVLDIEESNIVSKGGVESGKLFMVDMDNKKILHDKQIKNPIISQHSYGLWLKTNLKLLDDITVDHSGASEGILQSSSLDIWKLHEIFRYSLEDIKVLILPTCIEGKEPIGSMGIDLPLPMFSQQTFDLFSYYKQLFAQVTNPAIDPIREKIIMSVETNLGAEKNIFSDTPEHANQIRLKSPTLTAKELEKLKVLNVDNMRSKVFDTLFNPEKESLEDALKRLGQEVSDAVKYGFSIIILSDKKISQDYVAIPILLIVSHVHHFLIRTAQRCRVGIVVESGEPKEVMHYCLLSGYGACAWNPYLVEDTINELNTQQRQDRFFSNKLNFQNYRCAIDAGILKVATKMGISTLQSYRGAQIFEAIGLNKVFIDQYFTGTPSRIGGIGLKEIEEKIISFHRSCFQKNPLFPRELVSGGKYQWRHDGEKHLLSPDVISKLQHAVKKNEYSLYSEFASLVNDKVDTDNLFMIRNLIDFVPNGQKIDLSQVEPASEVVKRFSTGAMSLGSISQETHETLAIAMNRIGAKSNTGEGGESPERSVFYGRGDNKRSSIKQIASGRFGVNAYYLVNADDIQIKISQGAKPGEGGQLPGKKVNQYIANIRYSVPGVGLISPPPHHDIYSIEDISQLIYDLKNINCRARIHVKLVSEVGVGVVASGVSKAKADVILISGHDGGTGASALNSIYSSGLPWELGLAETQQALVMNGLRGRVVVQVDGKLLTGRDVAIAALMGAEEFGFSTAPLMALGCVMMRVCHLNTCPVGIATQDVVLRKKFQGVPENVINYFFFVAQELRIIMADLGFKTVDDMVGRVDKLQQITSPNHLISHKLDLSSMLRAPVRDDNWFFLRNVAKQDHQLDTVLDRYLIIESEGAIYRGESVYIDKKIGNLNRSVGLMLSGDVTMKHGLNGLPKGVDLRCHFEGSAGQSFAAFLCSGITFDLEGDANDYVGKGLSGGTVIIRKHRNSTLESNKNFIVGNVVLYGAVQGEAYFSGLAGERFAVRNSGVKVVVEGVGNHGCEYMTRGVVVVLGPTGRNFAAGMSGGIAYVYDTQQVFSKYCNTDMVDLFSVDRSVDIEELKMLIKNHHRYTDSAIAEKILNNFQDCIKNFVKVYPKDYRHVLEKQGTQNISTA